MRLSCDIGKGLHFTFSWSSFNEVTVLISLLYKPDFFDDPISSNVWLSIFLLPVAIRFFSLPLPIYTYISFVYWLGLDPVVDMSEDKINSSENDQKVLQLWWGSSLKGTFSREPYLVLSVVFVLSRAFLYFFPEIVFRAMALWLAHIPHLNMGVFGESRQLLGRVFQLIDIKRIWSKLKLCKTRNFLRGARNARVWASSLASVSLGESSSTRAFPSRDL